MEDGWFYWSFRDAVYSARQFPTAIESERFYQQVYEEITAAVRAGDLFARPTMPSALMSPWRNSYFTELPGAVWDAAVNMFQLTGVHSAGAELVSALDEGNIIRLENFTKGHIISNSRIRTSGTGWIVSRNGELQMYLRRDTAVIPIELQKYVDDENSQDLLHSSGEKSFFAFEVTGQSDNHVICIENSSGEILAEIHPEDAEKQTETDDFIFQLDSFEIKDSQAEYKKQASSQAALSNMITGIYSVMNYVLLAGLLFGTAVLIRWAGKKIKPAGRILLLEIGLLCSWILLLGGVSYTHISAYYAIDVLYLSSGYTVMYALLLVPGIYVVSSITKGRKTLKQHATENKLSKQASENLDFHQ